MCSLAAEVVETDLEIGNMCRSRCRRPGCIERPYQKGSSVSDLQIPAMDRKHIGMSHSHSHQCRSCCIRSLCTPEVLLRDRKERFRAKVRQYIDMLGNRSSLSRFYYTRQACMPG